MFKTHKERLVLLLKSPGFIMLVISLFLLSLQIAIIGKLRPFNSDDLYWQQVVHTWHPFNNDTFYFGTKDTFIALGPFFALMEHFFEPSRKVLVAETILLTAFSFTLFYGSSLYFLQKLRVKFTYFTLLPFAWLASFGYPLVQNYLNSDWRTFQIGFGFLTFALVAAVCNKDINPLRSVWSKILTAVAIIYSAVLIYGDPYYTFFTIGPLILFVGVLFLFNKIKRAQLLTVYGSIFLSLILAKVVGFICAKAGIVIVTETASSFVNFEDIVTNIVTSLHGLLIVFDADFFGRPIADAITVGFAVNAVILSFVIYKTLSLRKYIHKQLVQRMTLPELWTLFFGGTILFIFAVYTCSTLVTIGNYRYFIMLIYCAITLLAIVMGTSKNNLLRWGAGGLLAVAILFNIGYTTVGDSVKRQGDVAPNIGNSLNYDLIKAVDMEGLTKGYASYWQGNVNTYLSNNRVAFLPSLCTPDKKTVEFRWLIDGGQFDRQADKSFYLIDPDLSQPPTCDRKQLEKQFGKPAKVLRVHNKTILIYNYDITTKMQ